MRGPCHSWYLNANYPPYIHCAPKNQASFLPDNRGFSTETALRLRNMPKQRRPQPSTPPELPNPPADSRKKAYYPAGNKVYYCRKGGKQLLGLSQWKQNLSRSESEWRTGEIDNGTSSTQLHMVSESHAFSLSEVNKFWAGQRQCNWRYLQYKCWIYPSTGLTLTILVIPVSHDKAGSIGRIIGW